MPDGGRRPAHGVSNVPPVRGDVRSRADPRTRSDRLDSRRHAGRVQPGVRVPQGRRTEAAARGSRPRPHAARPVAGRVSRGELGRGVRADRRAAVADPGRRPQCRRRLPRQPERPQSVESDLWPGAAAHAVDAQRVLGLDGRSDAQAARLSADVRDGHDRSDPRRGPHRSPADARRQPARLQRQPDDGARHARPPARAARSGRQARRHRSAADPHRPGGRRAPLHPPRHRCPAVVRPRPRALHRGARRSGRHAHGPVDRPGRGARPGAAVHPRGGGRGLRHPGGRDPPPGARAGGGAPPPRSTAGSAPAPRSSERSPAGWSTCSTW